MGNQTLKIIIQVGLGLVIVGLGYWLYLSITGPWDAVEKQQAITDMTRSRMDKVRMALVRHERLEDRFPSSLDSLMIWVQQDSVIQSNPDSAFEMVGINLDSLLFSPRTGNMWEYAVNDTGRVAIYQLKDPDSNDRIGSLNPDVTLINAASWE